MRKAFGDSTIPGSGTRVWVHYMLRKKQPIKSHVGMAVHAGLTL